MPPKFSEQISSKYISSGQLAGQHRTSPCETACPAGNPIQKIHTLLADAKPEEAYEYILARNPLSGITSRVCPHPCEEKCNRKDLDQSISIKAIEQYVSDLSDKKKVRYPQKAKSTGKQIAIVGSGPAGLTSAYYLRLLGHHVTIFESEKQLGGIPLLLIPEFKLSRDIVRQEIQKILDVGVEVKLNTKIGQDISLEDLKNNHDAVVIASGAWQERRLNVEGEEACILALDFLKKAKTGSLENVGENIIIVGGGGVAFDCALVAKKHGASQVKIVCLEGQECLCAYPEDVAIVKNKMIDIISSKRVDRIVLEHGKVCGVKTTGIKSFEFDDAGCLSFEPQNDQAEKIDGDYVIMAIGQIPAVERLQSKEKLKTKLNGTIWVNAKTCMTSMDGVFATGDVALGPSTVAASIGHGRYTALHVDMHVMNRGEREETIFIDREETIERRRETQAMNSETHVVTFDEILNIDYYLDTQGAEKSAEEKSDIINQAMKCLHCGQCRTCWVCIADCPGLILEKGEEGPVVQYPEECWHCGCCRIACPSGAISYQFPLRMLL